MRKDTPVKLYHLGSSSYTLAPNSLTEVGFEEASEALACTL